MEGREFECACVCHESFAECCIECARTEPLEGIHNLHFLDAMPAPPDCWIVTDPPYNIGFAYPDHDDRMSSGDYRALYESFIGYRSVIVNYPDVMMREVIPVLGAPARSVAWVYNCNTSRQWRMVCWFNCKPDLAKIRQPYKNLNDSRVRALLEAGNEGAALYDWWEIDLVKNVSEEKAPYVNQIPEELVRRIVLTTVPAGELVFDPFCGSGTVPLVSRRFGYRYLGTDISERATRVAKERLKGMELGLFASRA